MSLVQLNDVSERQFRSPEDRVSEARILLIDDNEELLRVLETILRGTGYRVTAVCSADEALIALGETLPDLIICDVMMPGKDGFEFHREVKDNLRWCDIPFVFLTAMAGKEASTTVRSTGCDEYLTKPFDPDELLAVVRGKLAVASQRRKFAAHRLEGFRKRIIHTLSHEFRTPLVSINTGTELLLDRIDQLESDQALRLLESIQRGGQRLERLINDFMLLQQVDLGVAARTCERFRRRFSPVYLAQSAIGSFRERAWTPERMELVVEGEITAQIEVYDVHILDVLARLIGNAIKFAGADSPITIRVEQSGDEVIIAVRDRGPGIDPDAMAVVHSAFTQIDRDVLEQQGAGLGLTIAHCLTELNGGTMTLHRPENGIGLEVQLRFPSSN